MAFIIPKFIAVWTIPLLADAIVSGAVGAELADSLLHLLNVCSKPSNTICMLSGITTGGIQREKHGDNSGQDHHDD